VLAELRRKFRAAWPHLDERTRRLTLAVESLSLGYCGGLGHRASGLSRKAFADGIPEVRSNIALAPGRMWWPWAGRRGITISDRRLSPALGCTVRM
jgi:hypothetical protein